MSILDDAIREHLELKRAHGADEVELKRLEDEAFGPPQRPDEPGPFEEAPTEFLTAPEGEEPPPEDTVEGRRGANVADLQEPPPPPQELVPEPAAEPAGEERPEPEPPAEEEQPAAEHEAVPAPPADEGPAAPEEPVEEPSHTTEERQAISEQPTQFFDVEAEIGEAGGDQIEVEETGAAEAPPADDEEDFFSEQRLSEELDQALEAPLPGEEPPAPRSEEPIPPGPPTEEAEAHYAEREREEEEEGDEDPVTPDYEPESADHDDVLEDTPDFLEDAPEADDAWFEQRPPKDFDFDD